MSSNYRPFPGNETYRMIGSESEYTSPYNSDSDWEDHEGGVHGLLENFVDPGCIAHVADEDADNIWLSNGGRLYFDYGDILEYSTPECRAPSELVVHEKAGERIVADAVKNAGIYFTQDETTSWKTYKRSGYTTVRSPRGLVLINPMSAGHHENYASFLDLNDKKTHISLESYLASRAIWAGAGIVDERGYAIHQKAYGITNRPFIPPKPGRGQSLIEHGAKTSLRKIEGTDRIEIRLGDGNMSPWAIRTKYGMTSFVLRLIENDEFPDEAILTQKRGPLRRKISLRPEMSFDTAMRTTTCATHHQQMIARACLDFALRHPEIPVSRDEIQAAKDIEYIGNEIGIYLEDKDPEMLLPIADRIDWAAKLHYIHHRGIRDKDISAKNLEAVKLDLQWEELGDNTISARWYRRVNNTVDKRALEKANVTPPRTRAMHRVKLLGEVPSDNDEIRYVDWSRIVTYKPDGSDTEHII